MNEGDERIATSYRGNYPRLAAIKKKYDPGNLFRVNQNIQPAPRSDCDGNKPGARARLRPLKRRTMSTAVALLLQVVLSACPPYR